VNFLKKNYLYIRNGLDPSAYDWEKFSRDFFSIEPALGTVRLYRDGRVERQLYQQTTPQFEGAGHKFDHSVFSDILLNGGSMVVNRFEKSSTYVADVCHQVADFCGHAVVGNAYVTQGGTGTFGKHWDAHCVFAAQLIGAKHWKIFRPTIELPLPSNNFSKKPTIGATEMVFDGVLQAGNMLYVPRGWTHEVAPIAGQPSLHIAAGVHSPKVLDYLKWVLNNKLSAHIAARETMALNHFDECHVAEASALLSREAENSQSFQEYLYALKTSISEKPYINFQTMFR